MIKLVGIAAVAIVVAGPAIAQNVPPPYWGPFAAPRQSGPVAPGTATGSIARVDRQPHQLAWTLIFAARGLT